MKKRVEAFVIRWAVRRLKRILKANPNISYAQLDRYGVEDVGTNDFGEFTVVI